MGPRKITLYIDIVSPFAYLAFYVLEHSPVFKSVEITYVPILLGGLMKACNNVTPISIKNKDKWIGIERLRWARLFNVPFADELADGFPTRTLELERLLSSIALHSPSHLPLAIATFYNEYFVKADASINDPARHIPIITSVLSNPPVISHRQSSPAIDSLDEPSITKIINATSTKEVKDLLTVNTAKAFEDGAFGLPWFQCTNSKGEREGFWGFDHLGQVIRFLELDPSMEKSGGLKAML